MRPSLYRLALIGAALIVTLSVVFGTARAQGGVFAEALDHANVRSGPGVTYDTLTSITAGTRYPVVGRSAHFPWLLITLDGGHGWVFRDLVTLTGDIKAVPFVSDSTVGALNLPTPTETLPATLVVAPSASPTLAATLSRSPIPALSGLSVSASPSPTATFFMSATPPPSGVYAVASDSVNVRYGPGTEFPRVGVLTPGERYPVTRRHSQFKWIEIAYSPVAGGHGWVYVDAVKISGNLAGVPATSATTFGYPTLTATPNQVLTAAPPWIATAAVTASVLSTPNTPAAAGQTALTDIGNRIFDQLLTAKFEPGSARQASAFLLDLRSGAAVTLNRGVAYSAMSLIKIPILVSLYRYLDTIPTADMAGLIGEMMICSNNDASNGLLKFIGDGDSISGAQKVTETMDQLGLKNTFMVGAFASDPKATPAPLTPIKTQIDQLSADPDPFNQTTPEELGYLLGGIYQCALDGSGPLTAAFGEAITMTECRQMIRLLSSDKIGVMIEAGVPDNTQVAHKHGWIPDVLGDAGIVFTPGGDYVLIVIMHQKNIVWPDEFPKVSEIARTVYNAYNPRQPLANIHPSTIPATCTLDDALLRDIRAADMPPLH